MRSLILLWAFFATAHSRAVNISNTWVLPEEGFPVFYRYFRDRISWYEADAVCQFHHANLVTVDTTAQYDAVRAYLKELDISSAVWVGLIRSNPEGDFTWTDYRGLSGDGYWSSAPDPRTAPLCAAADPSADYRWEARTCGGPTVASFICELPVPQWALGNEGCMIRALPALTILYLPESAAVQLTADCGLAGVKRIQCTGNVKREDLLRDLSCTEEVEMSTMSNNISLNTTTTDASTITENQDTSNVITTEESLAIEHEYDDNQSDKMIPTPFNYDQITVKSSMYKIHTTMHPALNDINKTTRRKNINFDEIQNNNLQNNVIPHLVNNGDINYREEKVEDEKNIQHKKFHDELARLGNFETIFTQPTDHFVPPLVIAKARLSDDMTVLSLEEKHAQHFGAHDMLKKHLNERNGFLNLNTKSIITTEQPNYKKKANLEGDITDKSITLRDEPKKGNMKNTLPKKYIQNAFDFKVSKISKGIIKKDTQISTTKDADTLSTLSPNFEETATLLTTSHNFDGIQNDEVIDLTVTFREINGQKDLASEIGDKAEISDRSEKNDTVQNITELPQLNLKFKTESKNHFPFSLQNSSNVLSYNKDDEDHGVTKSSVEKNTKMYSTILDVTTKIPVFKDDLNTRSFLNNPSTTSDTGKINSDTTQTKFVDSFTETTQHEFSSVGELQSTFLNSSHFAPLSTVAASSSIKTTETTYTNIETSSVFVATLNTSKNNNNFDGAIHTTNVPSTTVYEAFNVTEIGEEIENNVSDLETIDDYQSPLLSAANEPMQRPNRSRRPKSPQNRINKFNPFRILG